MSIPCTLCVSSVLDLFLVTRFVTIPCASQHMFPHTASLVATLKVLVPFLCKTICSLIAQTVYPVNVPSHKCPSLEDACNPSVEEDVGVSHNDIVPVRAVNDLVLHVE